MEALNVSVPPVMDASSNMLPRRVHRDVTERVVAFLGVPQRACARGASKALWKAVRSASMEDLLRATVLEQRDRSAADAKLVVVAMSRVVVPFPADALVAWSGGLGLLYEELQLRFPHAAAIGISSQLAAAHTFPFASGSSVTTMCIVTAVAPAPSPEHAVESIVLGVRNTARILVRVLSHKNTVCPIVCLEGATPEQFPHMAQSVPLSSLPPIRSIAPAMFRKCSSLQSLCLANLPLLDDIGTRAFNSCVRLSRVDFNGLPSLRRIGPYAFYNCTALQSVSLANLPLLDDIGDFAFSECVHLSIVDLFVLPSLHNIGEGTFCKCKSLQSVSLANLTALERIGDRAFSSCSRLSSVGLSGLPSLRCIGKGSFCECESLPSISFIGLPLLESIEEDAFKDCVRLTSLDISDLASLRCVGKYAFFKCKSLQSIRVANLPLLESIDDGAFSDCGGLSNVVLSALPSLRRIGQFAFDGCKSLKSVTLKNFPRLESIGEWAFPQTMRRVDLSGLPSLARIPVTLAIVKKRMLPFALPRPRTAPRTGAAGKNAPTR